jgi:hypothetical protein
MNMNTDDAAIGAITSRCATRILRLAVSPPFHIPKASELGKTSATCPLLCPASDVIVFRQGTLTPASFLAREIILPNAVRRQRGRLTLSANIPLEVSAMQAKDVNLIHLLAQCKQRQLDSHLERIERFKKWRCFR